MMMLIMCSDERITASKHRDGHRDKKTIISFMCWLLLQPLIGVSHASTAMARPRHQWCFSTLVLTVKTENHTDHPRHIYIFAGAANAAMPLSRVSF